MKNNKDIELRSEEVQEVMGQVPAWIVRWGITLLFLVVVALLVGSCFFKYPDVITADMTLTGQHPATAVVTRAAGKIQELLVRDNRPVRQGDWLAVIENHADTDDAIYLDKALERSGSDVDSLDKALSKYKELSLGDMQAAYSGLLSALHACINYREIDYYPQKMTSIRKQIALYKAYYNETERQRKTLSEQFALTRRQYARDSLLGMVADRVNRKWLIVGSLFVWSFVTLMMGYCTDFNQIYYLRALMGVSEALYIPAGLSLITDYHQEKTRSLAVGIHMTGLYVGQALGGFGATVASAYTWETTFHWFGIIGIAYSVVLIIFLHDKKDHVEQAVKLENYPKENPISGAFKGLGMLFTNIAFWIILLYFATPSLPGWATKNWLPTLFAENLSLDMSEAGPLSTFTIAISSFIGVIAGGILSDKWIQRNVRGRVYTGAIGLALTIPSLLLLGFGHNFPMIIGGGLCFGIGYGIFDANNMPILCQFISPRYRATAYGIMNMTGVFAGAAITDILGKSTDAGNLGHDFAMLAGLVLIALLIQVIFLRPKVANMTDEC